MCVTQFKVQRKVKLIGGGRNQNCGCPCRRTSDQDEAQEASGVLDPYVVMRVYLISENSLSCTLIIYVPSYRHVIL